MVVRVFKDGKTRWLGLSTDTKPTKSDGANPGPRTGDPFIETDTGKVYIYTGSAWSAALTGAIVVVDLP